MKLQVPFVQLPLLFDADALAREVLALAQRSRGASIRRNTPETSRFR